ncbi:MAG: succinate dehydrogenase [Planctomycetota bacterium]|nr:succinate dehydrogenase [Planctomycetota bacterium]
MSRSSLALPQVRGFLQTNRKDLWWLQPAATLVGLLAFIVYSTWAAFQGAHYFTGGPTAPFSQHLLSPFYSPVLWDASGLESGHAWFGSQPIWWPVGLLFSPALFILPFPGLFRFTCYYYRGAYYKAFLGDPVSCAVGEPAMRGDNYRGEQKFPLVLQNVHRYALYIAIVFIFFLAWDAYASLWFTGDDGLNHFGVSVGSLVLTMNVVLLSGYTFGCHCWRHLVGGKHDCMSCSKMRHDAYKGVSWLNTRHMLFAWMSLFGVGFSDLYVRLCSMGVWTDWRIIG